MKFLTDPGSDAVARLMINLKRNRESMGAPADTEAGPAWTVTAL